MMSFILTILLLFQSNPGDEFHWPNQEWFRKEARQKVAAYPYLGYDMNVQRNAKVTLNIAGVLGAYVDTQVWSDDYNINFNIQIWIPLPKYKEWQSDSPTMGSK